MQKEFMKSRKNIFSRNLLFKFYYINKWHMFQLHICTETELCGMYGFTRNKTIKGELGRVYNCTRLEYF